MVIGLKSRRDISRLYLSFLACFIEAKWMNKRRRGEEGERDGALFIRYIRCIRNLRGQERDIKFHAADSLWINLAYLGTKSTYLPFCSRHRIVSAILTFRCCVYIYRRLPGDLKFLGERNSLFLFFPASKMGCFKIMPGRLYPLGNIKEI